MKIVRIVIPLVLLMAALAFCQDKIDRKIADNLLVFQNDNGGWPKNYDWDKPLDSGTNKKLLEKPTGSTIDNGATHKEIRYLSRAYLKLKDDRYRTAAVKGVKFLLNAQYPNGGYPQFYPYNKNGYNRYITFNDNAMIGVMKLLRDIADDKPEFGFIDKDVKKQAAQAVKKGIDCILKCQVVVKGKKTAWCAQHDEINFQPRKARSYELASISGSESVSIIYFLMEIDKPTPNIIEAVDCALAWFDDAKIEGIKLKVVLDDSFQQGKDRIIVQDPSAPPMWARFYEIGTNKPIFCSRDGIIKRNLSEISHERRNNYSWIGRWPENLLEKDYAKWKNNLSKLEY